MRRLSIIMVACAALMLLLFGAGGIGVQRCSCTGHVTFVSSTGGRCCKGSECMTVKVAQVSTAECVDATDCGWVQVPVCECVVSCLYESPIVESVYENVLMCKWMGSGPPGTELLNMVMRV